MFSFRFTECCLAVTPVSEAFKLPHINTKPRGSKDLVTTPTVTNRSRALICHTNSAKIQSNSNPTFLVPHCECLNRFGGLTLENLEKLPFFPSGRQLSTIIPTAGITENLKRDRLLPVVAITISPDSVLTPSATGRY